MNIMFSKIINKLNDLLIYRNEDAMDLSAVRFTLDKDVHYDHDCRISESNIYDQEQMTALIEREIKKGPSWIHANLIRSKNGSSLLTVAFGAFVGNPEPVINVSYEDRNVVLTNDV